MPGEGPPPVTNAEKGTQMAVAKGSAKVSEFSDGADVSESPDGWDWETVQDGVATKVIFDTVGDVFIGQYIRKDRIEREPAADGSDQSFSLYIFKGRDGENYSVQNSYSIDEGMESVDEGQWVRITFVSEVPTARKLNPMKSFKIDVRK